MTAAAQVSAEVEATRRALRHQRRRRDRNTADVSNVDPSVATADRATQQIVKALSMPGG